MTAQPTGGELAAILAAIASLEAPPPEARPPAESPWKMAGRDYAWERAGVL
jgi:hypothetical protein